MNKYTKMYYEELESIINDEKLRRTLGSYVNQGNKDAIEIATRFWKRFRSKISKKHFYEMLSDPHWKSIPMNTWYNSSGSKKAITAVLVTYLCIMIADDHKKAQKIVSKSQGIWVANLFRLSGAHSFSKRSLSKCLRSSDGRIYKRVVEYLSRDTLLKYIKTEKMSKSKRAYIEEKIKYYHNDDILSVSAWSNWSRAYHSQKKINAYNAKKVANFLSENMEKICEGKGSWYKSRVEFYLLVAASKLSNEDILSFVNVKSVPRIIKSRVILSEII